MIDTWNLENEFEGFINAIPDEVWTEELERRADAVQNAVDELEWDYRTDPHTDVIGSAVLPAKQSIVDLLTKVRMGVYSEAQHGSLQDVLEEIERLLP